MSRENPIPTETSTEFSRKGAAIRTETGAYEYESVPETTTEHYLRHIRNAVCWLVGIVGAFALIYVIDRIAAAVIAHAG